MTGARARSLHRLRLVRNVLAGLLLLSLVAAIAPTRGEAAPVAGSAGIALDLPATSSQVVVNGREGFSGMSFTVNQTRNLVNQAISVRWTGGQPTVSNTSRFQENYVQVMQCWGEDDGTNPANPGPPPTQCVWGASDALPDSVQQGFFPATGQTLTRILTRRIWPNFDPSAGVYDDRSGLVWQPFEAVDGTVVGAHVNPEFNPFQQGSSYWLNPYFNITTTNEVAGAKTGPNGEGGTLFRVDTGVESSGLGCGQRLVPAGGGAPTTPKCWLVIVPRGRAVDENVGTPAEASADSIGVYTSPLNPVSWKNRIAVPLDFNPVDSPCSISADDRRLVGSELALPAVVNWQPNLCSAPGAPPYTYGIVSDASARQQVAQPAAGAAGMAVTQAPLDPASSTPSNPVVYAPLTISGAVIGFNIERNPKPTADAGAQDLAGFRVANLNLTPRLVAKLLTQSYKTQTDIRDEASPYTWSTDNPRTMAQDPDFLRFNPEFADLQIEGRNFGGLSLPGRNSDLAREVWRWVLADPEAKAWLDGAPDEWGMKVNPVYATASSANVNGVAFGDPVPDNFPKADPYCYQALPRNGIDPPDLCGTDWMPYLQGLREDAVAVRTATDQARVVENPFAVTPDQVWRRATPQPIGRRAFLGLTDTTSAAQYGIQAASLSRAGDDGAGRAFVAPDTTGLQKGLGGLQPKAEPSVREPDPVAAAPGGYPLTAITYAAIRPLALQQAERDDYARLLDYAAGDGQQPGVEPGRLPVGYAPLPQDLRTQTAGAAATVRALTAPAPEPPAQAESPSGFTSPTPTSPPPARTATSSRPVSTSPTVAASASAPPVSPGNEAATEQATTGPLTPILALARNRFVIPILAGVALLTALAALEITKRPRRTTPEVVEL